VTAETLAAALHEQGIGCLQPTALSRDVCRPDKNAGDFHNEAARATLAALPVSPTDGLDVETLAQVIVGRFIGEIPADEWDIEFDWHRDEANIDKARKVAKIYLERIHRATTS
jgi:hypothetical protein